MKVKERIGAAARRAGRSPDAVRLIAVTKGHPAVSVRAAYEAGLREFGENRVEEASLKMAQLTDLEGVEWHMVGHVQSRKAAEVAGRFRWVHSVDRVKIASRLSRFAVEGGARLLLLLECNVSGERSKQGWPLADSEAWPEALENFAEIGSLPEVEIRGLMTMAPWTVDQSRVRATFRRLRELRDHAAAELGVDWPELSMGMSDDFELAVEEGATMIRIGRALFGPRPEPQGESVV